MSPEKIAAIEERLTHRFVLAVDMDTAFVHDAATNDEVDLDDVISERHADVEALLLETRALRSALETLGKATQDAHTAMAGEGVLPKTTGRLGAALDVATKALADFYAPKAGG